MKNHQIIIRLIYLIPGFIGILLVSWQNTPKWSTPNFLNDYPINCEFVSNRQYHEITGDNRTSNIYQQNNATSIQPLKIYGAVLDNEEKPLSDLIIQVYRDNFREAFKQEKQYRTKQDGTYEIQLDSGNSIILRLDSSNWHPTLINNLSGVLDQHINIIMRKAGFYYNQDEFLKILSVYERLYFIDKFNFGDSQPSVLDEKRKSYNRNLRMMKPIDSITKERYHEVLELYRKK